MTMCTVSKNGSSATVVLPAEWRRANQVEFGDAMEVVTDVQGQITSHGTGLRPMPTTSAF